jgi:hypothetical protein
MKFATSVIDFQLNVPGKMVQINMECLHNTALKNTSSCVNAMIYKHHFTLK